MMSSLRPIASIAGAALGLSLCVCISGHTVHAALWSGLPDTPAPRATPPAVRAGARVIIPGPLRSFLRMAGISQQASPEEVLPLLARNSYLLGYNESTQTEFLRLLNRYLHQARELQVLAGQTGTIRVAGCTDADTLLRVLGYRLRNGCGQTPLVLETTNATRAFLTIDSGFPLTELEESLQKGVPFSYAYPATSVPVLFSESDWLALNPAQRSYGSVLDVLANDPLTARLYWALGKNDSESVAALQQSPGLRKLLPYAGTLDFYGSQITIRSGHVVVPGKGSEADWKDLVGASPDQPGDFVTHLLARDNGWLAAYYDAMARASQSEQAHFTQRSRLQHVYEAFRSSGSDSPAARGVFPKAPDLTVLLSRLQWDSSDDIRIPGGLNAWKDIVHDKATSRADKNLAKRARNWDHPEDLLDALAAFSREESDIGPVQVYLLLSELDSVRPAQRKLSAATVTLLAKHFTQLSSWYLVFTEFPDLSDESISRFVTAADAVDKISDQALRGNAMGDFQASVGLWQIVARQGQIPRSQQDTSWQKMIKPFSAVNSSTQLFDAARSSLSAVMLAATGKSNISQDTFVDLLAGPVQDNPEGQQVHAVLAGRIRAVLNDQHLVSLDTLFALSDGLKGMAAGRPASDRLLSLAQELRDFELPRQIFSKSEKVDWAPRANTGHHAELQVKTDLTKVIKTPGTHLQLEAARGQLSPLLRDALVGLNYAYYEPPGAQILHINPLFVRSHDFIGITVTGSERMWQTPMLMGAGVSAGGGAYLMGSLADLPYSLATAEQDMITPENVQALIWKELVPELLADSVLARWWDVTPNELHAVALYQRFGEEMMTEAARSPELRDSVLGILSDRMEPNRLKRVELGLQRPEDVPAVLRQMLPADTFYLGSEYLNRFPSRAGSIGKSATQLQELASRYPTEVSWERLSRDFGVPHPTLARTYARELLNVKPFPFYGAYSSRLFGERWESGNLYWARLADEMGYSPVTLNRIVPELTRRMVAKIFATDLEDWPAVLRAMQETGEAYRQGKIVLLPGVKPATTVALTTTESSSK